MQLGGRESPKCRNQRFVKGGTSIKTDPWQMKMIGDLINWPIWLIYVLWTRNIAERKKMCHHSYSVFTHCEKFQLHNPSKTLKIKKWLDSTTIFFQWTLSYFLSDSFLLEQTVLLWGLFWFQNMSQESQCKVWSKSYKVSWSFEKKNSRKGTKVYRPLPKLCE